MSEALHFNKIAAAMLRRGIPVIPVKARDKVPIPVAWQTKASIRPNDILQWIAQYGNEINCGAVATLDGQWMLDADNPGLWNLIESETGHKLPRTFTTASRKGQHKYWKQTPASRAMDNRKSHTPPYEFDAQVDRKQVIAPGSTHPSGFVYQIVDDCDIVEAPDWLCEWVAGHGDKDKAPVTKGRISVHEDFDFEDVMNHFNISGRWDDSWFITDECPISGYKHEQSTRTGFYYDGDTFGFHCFAGGCRGSEMSVGQVIAYLNAKNIKEGEAPYKGVIWSSDDDLLVGVDDLDLTEDMIEATFENHSGREDNPGVVDGKLLPIEERLQRMAPAAPPELETPAIIVMPKVTLEMPDDCMYGELGILAKECKTPLGLTYPSLITCYSAKVKADFMCGIRVNIYGGLIAPPESGKNVTIDRSIEILELARGYDYRKAAPAGDTQLAIILGDEASGTLTAKQTAGRMGGWLSANDIREQLGMEPVPGGDVYIRPLNYVDATTAAEGIETDSDPEDTSPDDDKPATDDPEAQAAKVATNLISQSLKPPPTPSKQQPRSVLEPLFNDAYSRLQNRAKKDVAAITQTLAPVCSAVGVYFRSGNTVGPAEQKAIDKYLTGLETRLGKTTPDAEFRKLLKSLIYAVEEDASEMRAKEQLEVITNE